jgi:hypothetical protein
MISGLLDLDLKESWHSDFKDLVYSQEVWHQVEAKFATGQEQGSSFLSQFTYADDSLDDHLVRFLRQNGREILLARYSHVAGYHGCRPKDPTSYTSKGILPSNTEALISEARSLFVGIEGFDEALQDIKEWYLNHNEGKVGLLFSALRAQEDHNPYVRGSELIRGLANRLGEIAKSRHAGTGKPMFIKCAIPVGWLDTHTTFATSGAYSNWVLEELIRMRKWPHDNFIGCEGGYMLTRAVPPRKYPGFH